VARTDLTSGMDTNNNSVYTTSSFAPAVGSLVLVFVLSANTGFGAAGVPTATGNGLTWDRVDTANTGQFRLTCFRAMRIGTPASGTVRFEFRDGAGALQTQDLCAWSIFEYSNVDLGGTNGFGAVVVHPQAAATAATKLTAPLPLANQINVEVGGIILALQLGEAAHPVTPGVGFTEIHEQSPNQGFFGKSATLQTQDRTGGQPSIDWSWTGAESAAAIVLEVKTQVPIIPVIPDPVVYKQDNEFIRAFEPILYFAPGERFFPADAKRYLERCALWNTVDPFTSHDSWHPPGGPVGPIVDSGMISAKDGEAGTFLGQQGPGGSLPFLVPDPKDERFLDISGWGQPPGPANSFQFADLDRIEELYSSPTADPLLKDSRFWYHAEVFDMVRLRTLMAAGNSPANFPDIFSAHFSGNSDFKLICYYLFFPGHDEPLENCAPDDHAEKFCSYAGEWACIAILVEGKTTANPVGSPSVIYTPTTIGLTGRNVGDTGFRGGEERVKMRALDFNTLNVVSPAMKQGETVRRAHPRLFVAKGTHSIYEAGFPLPVPVPFFAPEDPAFAFCGATETLGKSYEDLKDELNDATDDVWVDDPEVFWTKFVINIVWAVTEWIAGGGGGFDGVATGTPDQFDNPPKDEPGAASFGAIVHPAGVDPPNGGLTVDKFPWQSALSNEPALEHKVGDRLYSLRVNRTDANVKVRQVFWPGIQGHIGYTGRWGQRVTNDPQTRRAGLKFPEFWVEFMNAFAKGKSQ
jgi:hypothetical protein